ncbi:MAG: enoyl-ACP reductase, partial [Ornithinimicrobium sp.]
FLPAPGEGPSEEQRAAGMFEIEIDAETTTGAQYSVTVAAPYDPGYDGTAVMLGESGLALAAGEGSERVGVLTPATALGEALVDRLRAQGFTFTVSPK